MQFDLVVVFGLLILAPFLFAWKRLSIGLAALIIMAVLMLTGVLSPQDGLSGFSNSATITIASMFVVSQAILLTGGLEYISNFFSSLGTGNRYLSIFIIMLIIAVISAFINNTAAVAIFIPVIISVSKQLNESPSKLLIPLSFASMFGGVCTLIGTSTNVLVSSIATENGFDKFSMFEFTPLGLILLLVGFIYLFTFGIKLVPRRRQQGSDLTQNYEMPKYLTEVELLDNFKGLGSTLNEGELLEDLDLDILEVFPAGKQKRTNKKLRHLQNGDTLRIRGKAKDIAKLVEREDIAIKPTKKWRDIDFTGGEMSLVEVVIAPESSLESKKVRDVDFAPKYEAIVLALRSRGKLVQEDLSEIRLSGGDSLLLYVDSSRIEDLKKDPSFVVVSEIGYKEYKKEKLPIAIAILTGIILTAALGIFPIAVAAFSGSILLVILGCLNMQDALSAINWKVIFLLAGVLPLGAAMDKSGAAMILSNWLLKSLQQFGPQVMLAGFFLLSMLLTNIISNQATAALLAPIAISFANDIGANPRAFLIAITFAASLSFITPVGYQTNTLILGPGNYKFTDFLKIGLPLNLILWIVASILIPVYWPL